MILRDAILSDVVRTVGAPRRAPAAPALERDESPVRAAFVPAVATPEVISQPATVPLTFETVTAWLAVQDDETRIACASVLADELTLVQEEAKARGFAAGEQEGREAMQKEAEARANAFQALVEAAEGSFREQEQQLAESCAEIVAEVMAKVAGPLLSTREAIVGAVITVLARVKEGRELSIRVHPDDLPVLRLEQDRIAAALSGRSFSIVPDARVQAGGCIAESSLGSLDGRLEVQLREIFATLRSVSASVETR